MSEPYDLTADPEPIDELQRELERIGRAVAERAGAHHRARALADERVGALSEADVDRRHSRRDRRQDDLGVHGAGAAERSLGPADPAHDADHADHAERLADRLTAQQLDAVLVQTRLLAERSQGRPATAILHNTTGPRTTDRPIRTPGRRGRALPAGRHRAADRHAG